MSLQDNKQSQENISMSIKEWEPHKLQVAKYTNESQLSKPAAWTSEDKCQKMFKGSLLHGTCVNKNTMVGLPFWFVWFGLP